jgi:dihydropteroate synthase
MTPLCIAGHTFDWGRQTYIMGIVNVTPDSFSGDGLLDVDAAVALAVQMVADGAHLIDVGGESTRPGSAPVPADEELRRVIPVIQRLMKTISVPISIDTYKAEVARAALDAGAHLVNDVWALRADPGLAPLIADRGVPVILMHNRSRSTDVAWQARIGGIYLGAEYQDVVGDIARELGERIAAAEQAGINRSKIIVDPGIGFGKTVPQHLELIDRLGELRSLGCPILIGPSRKSFIGQVLDLPAGERVEGTAAVVAVAITRGVDIVRVHDVKVMARVVKMVDALVRRYRLEG